MLGFNDTERGNRFEGLTQVLGWGEQGEKRCSSIYARKAQRFMT